MKVICIGNRFAYPDNFGILIYEKLKNIPLDNCTIIEGGVGGLSLMPYFEDDEEILIIDYGVNMPKIITNKDIEKLEINEYNHANAFLYLLKTINKPYTIYCCNENFDENNLDKYINEIITLIKGN